MTDGASPKPLSAEHWPVESYVREEMDERGWCLFDLCAKSGLSSKRAREFLQLGMWGDDIAPAMERAFGIDRQTWENLWIRDVGVEIERQAKDQVVAALQAQVDELTRQVETQVHNLRVSHEREDALRAELEATGRAIMELFAPDVARRLAAASEQGETRL